MNILSKFSKKIVGYISLSLIFAFAALTTVTTQCTSCSYINEKVGLPDDNPIEEAVEDVIDAVVVYELGVNPNIDLTPSTPEIPLPDVKPAEVKN